jgi:hypothetical protein
MSVRNECDIRNTSVNVGSERRFDRQLHCLMSGGNTCHWQQLKCRVGTNVRFETLVLMVRRNKGFIGNSVVNVGAECLSSSCCPISFNFGATLVLSGMSHNHPSHCQH